MEQVNAVVNIGGRAWSTFAPIYTGLSKFRHISGAPPLPSAEQIIQRLAGLAGAPVYVSLDADVVDPAFAPNVSCPEPFGLQPEGEEAAFELLDPALLNGPRPYDTPVPVPDPDTSVALPERAPLVVKGTYAAAVGAVSAAALIGFGVIFDRAIPPFAPAVEQK